MKRVRIDRPSACSQHGCEQAERLAEIIDRHVDLVPEHELDRHIRPYVLAKAVDL